MAAQNFKKEDWGNGDTKLGQNWHKNFQACSCLITTKFSPVVNYELKFVKNVVFSKIDITMTIRNFEINKI